MIRSRNLLLTVVFTVALAGKAMAVSTNGGYVTTPPNVTNWDTGWGASGITGWDYVGTVGGASGVYLGNNWVITAAHVGVGNFTTAGITYSYVPGTATTISNSTGTADLVLFQIATAPTLPSLTIRATDPLAESALATGSTVVMIGYGGGAKSWGANVVTGNNENINVGGRITTTFYTRFGLINYGTHTINNRAMLVSGDSGGAAFIYNSSTGRWELAGLNEAVGTDTNGNSYSFLSQLNVYASQINAITATTSVPEPAWAAGIGAVVALIPIATRLRRRLRDRKTVA